MVLIYASASVTTAKYPKQLLGEEKVETLLILALIPKTPEFKNLI